MDPGKLNGDKCVKVIKIIVVSAIKQLQKRKK